MNTLSVTYEEKLWMAKHATVLEPQWTAETIRAKREALKLTQRAFSEKLGCRQQTISEWELGVYMPGNAHRRLLTIIFGRPGQ